MTDTDTIEQLVADLRAKGHGVFAERLDVLRTRQMSAFQRYAAHQRQMIDVLVKQATPVILDATAGMRRGV